MSAFGEAMKKMRADAHLSLRQLAETTYISYANLSRFENGHREPKREDALAIDRALSANGQLVALLPDPDPAIATRESERLSRLIDTSSQQRGDDLLQEAERLAVEYLSTPPGPMLTEASTLRRDALTALRKTKRPASLVDIALALAQMSGVLAYAALDLGQPAQAMIHAQAAFDAADGAGAGEFKAWVRGTQSLIARFVGDYPAALRFAVDGLRYTQAGTAQVRLLCGVAQCQANMGDATAARAALDQATGAREDISGTDQPGLFGFSEAKQAYYSGSSLIWLSDQDDARRALGEAARAIEMWRQAPADERSLDDEALAHVYAATASVQIGELERAEAWLAPILDLPPDQRISWIRKRMGRVAVLLSEEPFVRDPLAVELRQRIAEYR